MDELSGVGGVGAEGEAVGVEQHKGLAGRLEVQLDDRGEGLQVGERRDPLDVDIVHFVVKEI